MIDTNALLGNIQAGVEEILKGGTAQYTGQASQDASDFIGKTKADITEWAQQLADGKISKDDFDFLARGRLQDLAEMDALTQAGIAAATLDRIKLQIADFVIATIIKAV